MEKNCITCGHRLVGRTDKKFCSDGCRYTHHNQLNSGTNNTRRRILYAARKNRIILEHVLDKGITKLTRTELESLGFNFQAITGIQKPQDEHPEMMVFEILLQEIRGYFRIRKAPETQLSKLKIF
jgi:hypothetical protein